ncbi:hypothetical protein [Micromonospora ureilytica]|uniref:Uncharacterized protein n=1 Tax=Micromonospora ureilytica TaxID=709868 RepID=A0ABS0JQR2_9ACTN|nr:hypothetical protein [Micromonospora ureilytica]MBG6069385.1 hypothetical protein [Micromonospora ureilytica]
MPTALSDPDDHPGQHNHSSGVFVGRDNYGSIEMVDEKTKAALRKLSKDAPDLGKLLSRALKEGVITPGTVLALETAARSINEDVARALWVASRNINEDVARWLLDASSGINEGVARMFLNAAQDIQESAKVITEATHQLQSFRLPAAAAPLPVMRSHQADSSQYIRVVLANLTRKVDRIERSTSATQATTFAAGVTLGALVVVLLVLAF